MRIYGDLQWKQQKQTLQRIKCKLTNKLTCTHIFAHTLDNSELTSICFSNMLVIEEHQKLCIQIPSAPIPDRVPGSPDIPNIYPVPYPGPDIPQIPIKVPVQPVQPDYPRPPVEPIPIPRPGMSQLSARDCFMFAFSTCNWSWIAINVQLLIYKQPVPLN